MAEEAIQLHIVRLPSKLCRRTTGPGLLSAELRIAMIGRKKVTAMERACLCVCEAGFGSSGVYLCVG